MIEINPHVRIPDAEIEYAFSASSKPGGQKVNKTSTRVRLTFDVASSPILSEGQRKLIMRRLQARITKDGLLRVVSQRHRSQLANRRAALERLAELLRGALAEAPRRKRTAAPQEAAEKRLKDKKRRGLLKGTRARVTSEDR
jgi:ribosome-associated protein